MSRYTPQQLIRTRISPTMRIRGPMSEYVRAAMERDSGVRGTDGPVNLYPPTIEGTPALGETLTCVPGAWTYHTSLAYQWKRDGVNIGGATAATHVLVVEDGDAEITCVVTATNVGGSVSEETPESVSPPYDPFYETGVAFDIRADAGVTANGSNHISQIVDQKGGKIFARTASAAQVLSTDPAANDAACIVANGTGAYTPITLALGSGTHTIYAWFSCDDAVTLYQPLFDSQSGRLLVSAVSPFAARVRVLDGGGERDIAAPVTGPQLLVFQQSAATLSAYRNRTSLGSQACAGSSIGGAFGLLSNFQNDATTHAKVKLYRMIIATAAHDATARDRVTAWGEERFGL